MSEPVETTPLDDLFGVGTDSGLRALFSEGFEPLRVSVWAARGDNAVVGDDEQVRVHITWHAGKRDVGTLSLVLTRDLAWGEWMILDEPYRRRGVLKRTLRRLVPFLRDLGIDQLAGSPSHATSAAIFRRVGFQQAVEDDRAAVTLDVRTAA